MARPIELTDAMTARFWSKVERAESGCWLWTGSRTIYCWRRDKQGRVRHHGAGSGYGLLVCGKGTTCLAHRYSFVLHKGPIPDGLYVTHSCDVPFCVNPDHLSPGSAKENMADAVRKGRMVHPKKPKRPGIDISAPHWRVAYALLKEGVIASVPNPRSFAPVVIHRRRLHDARPLVMPHVIQYDAPLRPQLKQVG